MSARGDGRAVDSSDLEVSMTTVETALGPVATAELGPTLMHEHIVTRSPGVHENWPHLFDRDAILAIAERKMADILPALRGAGVTEDQVEQMLVRTPRAIFEASGR